MVGKRTSAHGLASAFQTSSCRVSLTYQGAEYGAGAGSTPTRAGCRARAAIVVGGSIGLGILSMPGIIAGKLGDPFLIIAAWIAGGLFTFLGANIYAELGTAFPKAGGPYVYVREAAGPFAGFVTGWSDTAISVIATAAQAAAFGLYLENDVLDSRAVAIAELGVLFAVNWFGLKVGARTQQALSLFKVGGLVLLALACLALGGVKPPSDVQLFEHGFGLAGMIAALMLVTETYAGWNSGSISPRRTRIPTATFHALCSGASAR
nr:amino acid permease [Sphingomonas sediminicola]